MKPKWMALGAPVAVAVAVTGSLLLGSLSAQTAGRQPRANGRAIPTQVLGETLTAASVCPTNSFCISGSVTGIRPGSPQFMTLTLSNPNNFPVYVTSLTVSASTPSSAPSCPAAVTITSPGWTAHDTSPVPTDAIPVAAATSSSPSGYGTATQTVIVSWTDSTTQNQTPCLSTVTNPVAIPLTYGGTAKWYAGCVSGNQGRMTVKRGETDCVSSTGKVNGGITVGAGGSLILQPGASVNGGIKESSGATQNLFCGARITGGVSINGSTGSIVIGNGGYCTGNSITGGLVLTNNTEGLQVIGNNVTGGYTINRNTSSSAQLVESNTGSGGMTCSGNVPKLSDGGASTANSVTGPKTGDCAGSF